MERLTQNNLLIPYAMLFSTTYKFYGLRKNVLVEHIPVMVLENPIV